MKKSVVSILLFMFVPGILHAQLPTPVSLQIPYTVQEITIDGYNDDALWSQVPMLTFPYTMQYDFVAESDFSATIQLAWTNQGLLAFVSVVDDMEHFLEVGTNSYLRDNAEFFFYFGDDFGPNANITEIDSDIFYSQLRIQLTDAYETASDGRYLGGWTGAFLGRAEDGYLEAVAQPSSSGWDIEVLFPWELFAMINEPIKDMAFGFDVTLGDADEGDRDFQLSLLTQLAY